MARGERVDVLESSGAEESEKHIERRARGTPPAPVQNQKGGYSAEVVRATRMWRGYTRP